MSIHTCRVFITRIKVTFIFVDATRTKNGTFTSVAIFTVADIAAVGIHTFGTFRADSILLTLIDINAI